MEENNRNITTLHNLLDYDAGRFISAEIQLQNILPEWINKATSLKLKGVLQKYFDYVQVHIQRLEGFIAGENTTSVSNVSHIMQAYISEADEKFLNCADTEVKDACLLACVQAINHFKISAYGTAAAFANALGMEKYTSVFHEAGVNEKQIDDRLSQLAEHEINLSARAPIVLPG
ncbi:MAG: DUF892 family protein [Chitinophagaceae bacterium]|nr:DUF892 family protein [Chitinophagaceae bacterium]